MALQDIKNQHHRLSILRALEALGYRSNDSMIQDTCEAFHNIMSRDQVRTNLRWLEEQGLVTVDTVHDIMNATLTSRGQDVAHGKSFVDGVKRPSA
ncbi:VpaChn25_0724 family phage protein [Thalassotalea euphylliae]|uniref:ArsR family transcriptional regulator n=1 Tax=Thalassotalea euphylliae TaxID=1655234 RepID=A0A3E0U6G8_9GAMM|nr:ArsR family transcriptional regulator [Thalassotalea euphylliae]REL32526.1 ArsR family transcriptional regulator [Thalassotalea euphylliae]